MDKKIMRFPEGKTKAVTLSYDDSIEADRKLIRLMEKYKIKGTFNLIPGWFAKEGDEFADETYRLVTEKAAEEIYTHPLIEVANHGDCHKYMTTLSAPEMADDTIMCRKKLEKLFGRIVRGMAYPYGWYDSELIDVLKMCGIVYSRTVNSTENFELPKDFMEWHPTCHHDNPALMKLTEDFVGADAGDRSMLFYLWGHSFEFERNGNWQTIEDFMSAVSGREDIWYATNMEIYEYVQAYNGLSMSADGRRIVNMSRIPVWVEIDGTLYQVKDEIVLD